MSDEGDEARGNKNRRSYSKVQHKQCCKPPLSLLHAHALTHTHARTHAHTHTLGCTNRQGIYSELASQAYRAAVAFGGHW